MIQTTEQITQIIRQDAMDPLYKLIRDLIVEHRTGRGRIQKSLYDRYLQVDVPILSRKPAKYENVDRRIPSDFLGDIVDTKVGYMGNEVTVEVDRSYYGEGDDFDDVDFDRDGEALHDFRIENDTLDLNSEAVRMSAICGLSYRLLYVDVDGEARPMNLHPWEVIYVYDQSINRPQVAFRFYEMQERLGEQERKLTVVEMYDEENITYFIDDGRLNFKSDLSKGQGGVQPHLFTGIPVIPMLNNEHKMGDAEKALRMIDAYDAVLSSTASEIEQLRMAYMFVKGSGMDVGEELIKDLEQTGIFPLSEDGEVGFVNKQINDTVVKDLLSELRRNIYQFAKSIDMSKDFSGDMRVMGWQVALLNLENAAQITERKFTRALRTQYAMLTEYWRAVGHADIDPASLSYTFTRNFPKDNYAEAQTLEILVNHISKRTAFGMMSFIDDPEDELQRIEEERELSPYREDDANTRPTNEQQENMADDGDAGEGGGPGANQSV